MTGGAASSASLVPADLCPNARVARSRRLTRPRRFCGSAALASRPGARDSAAPQDRDHRQGLGSAEAPRVRAEVAGRLRARAGQDRRRSSPSDHSSLPVCRHEPGLNRVGSRRLSCLRAAERAEWRMSGSTPHGLAPRESLGIRSCCPAWGRASPPGPHTTAGVAKASQLRGRWERLIQSRVLFLTIFAAGIGGTFQFGYNLSIINAPTLYIQEFTNETWQVRTGEPLPDRLILLVWSLIVSLYPLGGLLGALLAGHLAVMLGR
uniref:Major facilitator superfamily (MFS) profile domain-containing protein n=3 Tax=Oryctolagus cuniculus TaxID=9986 RepID=A0A5F9C510_RABIT